MIWSLLGKAAKHGASPEFDGTSGRLSVERLESLAHMPTCFVSMPFGTKEGYGDEDKLYSLTLKPAITEAGYQSVRADELRGSDLLASVVRSAIENADVFLSVISASSSWGLYELGIARGIGKSTIVISQESENLPFGLSLQRVLNYRDDGHSLDKLRRSITRSLKEILDEKIESKEIQENLDREHDENITDSDRLRTLITQTQKLKKNREFDSALKISKEALVIQEKIGDRQDAALLLNLIGSIYEQIGDYSSALRYLEEAAEVLSLDSDPVAEATVYGNMANIFQRLGQIPLSIHSLASY